ncbi:MAG: S-formylglutathione hydrolase [Proteobacteria bacterium]|jgi:S-formylglutathione hydrolase|nr:S-formylglutathione hydrolase [Pseudomonadota bacterium]MBT5227219.1 S-formylglutathione hydrolase [Pseudomonadota bacterium]MBT5818468.1 S-formylglutathione hydrolase [Pseudomonadota bacterium]MBT6348828.1 S-formylglutathione hydrolase [Pseudomonadota bacterium]
MECIQEVRTFGGTQRVFRHASSSTRCDMEFAVFDPTPENSSLRPTLFYLSGLTCTWANVADKAGAQRYAAEHGIMLVMPDTSPRGLALPGEDDDYDFGSGAGFYINATQAPWSGHYRMFDYVSQELPGIVTTELQGDPKRLGVMGHSMGGHGALICALKNPDVFRSCSAFAPISNPVNCPWGEKAFSNYLGQDRTEWENWDACALVSETNFRGAILVDQGDADTFLEEQLKPEALRAAFGDAGRKLELRIQSGYDHSYSFIASFIGDHIAHHARQLSS